MRGQTTSLLPRGDGAHSWTSCSEIAARGSRRWRRAPVQRVAPGRAFRRRGATHVVAARQTFVAIRGITAHRTRRWRRTPVQRESGSRRQACRKARRQCRASSRRELHRAWHLAMAEALFCSTRRPGWRRKGLLFGLRRRSPKGPRRALRRLAEVRFCSTRVRELPRMGFLFSLRHHAPRHASRRSAGRQLRRAHQKQTSGPTGATPAAGGRASARRRRRRRRGNPNTNRTHSTTPRRS